MKKRLISILIFISGVILLFVFSYRDIIFNIPEIKSLKNNEKLYTTYSDHNLSVDNISDTPLTSIELNDIKFQHAFKNMDNEVVSSDRHLSINNNKVYLNVLRGEIDGVFYLTDDVISKRIKSYITDVYGNDILDNNFDFYEKVLSITPDDLSLLKVSRKELVANFYLLRCKSAIPPNPIVKFQTGKIQGFQNGIANKDSRLTIDIFNRNNKSTGYCQLSINGPTTQEEVDVILKTFEFIN